jgi:methylated-DNA-[protein]-cysteine S-methyltransferase
MFADEIFAKLKSVPPGRVTTYGELAKAVGRPGAARAVGNALNKNERLRVVPCHRVVKSSGELGGFALGDKVKVKYLADEGIEIKNGRVWDFKAKLFRF